MSETSLWIGSSYRCLWANDVEQPVRSVEKYEKQGKEKSRPLVDIVDVVHLRHASSDVQSTSSNVIVQAAHARLTNGSIQRRWIRSENASDERTKARQLAVDGVVTPVSQTAFVERRRRRLVVHGGVQTQTDDRRGSIDAFLDEIVISLKGNNEE